MEREKYMERVIYDVVKAVTDIDVIDVEDSLLDIKYGIFPADFLYIFSLIEREVGCDVTTILVGSTHEVMSIKNLAQAISNIDCLNAV